MSSREKERLMEIYDNIIKELLSDKEKYKDFLTYQSRFYKYPFEETIILYGKNPDATAYGTLSDWNKIGRRIHAGTRSTRVFSDTDKTDLKYLFELSDTYGADFSYPSKVNIYESNQNQVLDSFDNTHELDSFDKNFKVAIEHFANSHMDETINDFQMTDDLIAQVHKIEYEKFKETIIDSVGYILCERFNIPKGIYDNDMSFAYIEEINSKEILNLIGTVSQKIAGQGISHINQVLRSERRKEYEKEQRNEIFERDQSYDGRGRSDSRRSHGNGETRNNRGTPGGEIRSSIPSIHGGGIRREENYTIDHRTMGQDSRESGRGSKEQNGRLERDISEELPKTDRHNLHENTTVGERLQYVGGRISLQRDSVSPQIEEENIEQSEREPIGSFSIDRKIQSKTIEEQNYEHFEKLFPDIINKKYDYIRLENEPFQPLSIEFIAPDVISFMHTYIQMGDLMYDPDMTFRIDIENKTITPLTFEQSSPPLYQVVEHDSNPAGARDNMSHFYRTWLRNIEEQGHIPVRALKTIDGEYKEYIFDENGNEIQKEKEAKDETEKEMEMLGDDPKNILIKTQYEQKTRPRFFENEEQMDEIDINLYNDGDIIGYTTEGISKTLRKTNDITYFARNQLIMYEGIIFDKKIPQFVKNEYIKQKEQPQNEQPQEIIDVERAYENFVIRTNDDIGLLSGKGKFRENIRAIETLKLLEKENRKATAEEQRALAKYSGFGGLPQVFDNQDRAWQKEYEYLKEVLTQTEYESLSGSVLNAHYTSNEVIQAMYRGLENLGFDGGNILEPSMGTGYFFGLLPENLRHSQLYGVELDSISGRISQQLYPDAHIQIKGFEETNFQTDFFDAAIGNVPFGNYGVHDTKFNKHNFLVHDYFIAKSIDLVRPNGLIAYITSKGTMDKADSKAREYIAERAELLGAIRLPNTAFKKSADTEVTTDILFFRKRDRLVDASREDWVYVNQYETGKIDENGRKEKLPLNEYYINNPHMMLGDMVLQPGRFGKEATLIPYQPIRNLTLEEKYLRNFDTVKKTITLETEEQKQFFEKIKSDATTSGEVFEQKYIERSSFFFRPYNYYHEVVMDNQLDYIIDFVNQDPVDLSDKTINELLHHAISFLPKNIYEKSIVNFEELKEDKYLPADPEVKNFCYKEIDGEIYQRENSIMVKQDLPKATRERMLGLVAMRETVRHILDMQVEGCTDEALETEQEKLNNQYEDFTKVYEQINTPYHQKIFGEDGDAQLLFSIEEVKDDTITKADIFTKRTIAKAEAIIEVNNAHEALAVSLNQKGMIDIPYMSELYQSSEKEIIDELDGLIFKNPLHDLLYDNFELTENWETADEYLSGDVVGKLETAKQAENIDPIYARNIQALEEIQPSPLQAHEITTKIGASWIDIKYYEQFIAETFNLSVYAKTNMNLSFSELTGTWYLSKNALPRRSMEAIEVYGTKRMDGFILIENMLNQKKPKIYDYIEDLDGKKKAVLNTDETIAIQERYKLLDEKFRNWIFDDIDRRDDLVKTYNRQFNSTRERQHDGSFLNFPEMSPGIKLRPHQKNAVARTMFGGNTLLAHVVGSGKTFIMTASALELKRLGLVNKPCLVVPNHIVNQIASEAQRLYPRANILSATSQDFAKAIRERFCGRIATGNWDLVVIGHSSFERIPISQEKQEKLIRKQIDTARFGLEDLKNQGDRILVKDIERTIKSLETQLKKLLDSPKDDLITFEELGIDALYIDEAHGFKNKYLFTKMGNVAGINRHGSKKSQDMELKCNFINELHGDERHVVFATGTPVSNSMTELYTMMTYLMPKRLEEKGLHFFDNWASNFGEVVSSLELAPAGRGFRVRDRFGKFVNVPELMSLYREVADIQTNEMLDLPMPDIKYGKPQTISVKPSPIQKVLVDGLVELSEKCQKGEIPLNVYNMLCVTNDGRNGACDIRIVDREKFITLLGEEFFTDRGVSVEEFLQDYEGSKVNACIENAFSTYQNKDREKLTQMIFCDISTPKTDGSFSVYNDIKEKLIDKGIPENEIAFIHDAKTDKAKEDLFSDMRTGRIRVLLGSTQKMGAGTNAQDKLYAVHHLDCPWRPSDLEQRNGRILRQGNDNPEVEIFQYVTEGTFDSYLWQIVETKQRFISQVMTGKDPSRSMEDVDATTLNFAEVKAIATGNPLIKRKMELEIELSNLKVLERQFNASKYELENKVQRLLPHRIENSHKRIMAMEKDLERFEALPKTDDFHMRVGAKEYNERKQAGELLLHAVKSKEYIDLSIGEYKGFEIIALKGSYFFPSQVALRGYKDYLVNLSESATGNITRIENAVNGIGKNLSDERINLEELNKELGTANTQVRKPFDHADTIKDLSSELARVNNNLGIKDEEDLLIVDTKNDMEDIPDYQVLEDTSWEIDIDM